MIGQRRYSCGCDGVKDALEACTQWVGNKTSPFQLSFDPSLKVDFQGSRVTSDGGLLLARELDERLGLSELIAEHLTDSRRKNGRTRNCSWPICCVRLCTAA